MSGLVVRPAAPEDAAGCAAVYAPYVTDSCISFEYEAPTAADFAGRDVPGVDAVNGLESPLVNGYRPCCTNPGLQPVSSATRGLNCGCVVMG